MQDACRAIFNSAMSGSSLQDEVYETFSNGECEQCSVSEHSPGPVENDEILTKLIVDPIHFDNGIVSPAAFTDAYTLDLSLFRENYAGDAELQLAINQIKATGQKKDPIQKRQIVAVMHASAAAVRQLQLEEPNERMCLVYDTAEADKPAHASIFTPSRARKSKKDQRAIRRALLDVFGQPTVLDAYRRSLVP